jgi:hypothetical protein
VAATFLPPLHSWRQCGDRYYVFSHSVRLDVSEQA